ncbi:unnamed protein product, partial [Mesorhabditis spiculigera]
MADVKVDSSDSDQDPKKKRGKNSRNTKAIHSASDQSSDEEVAPPPKKAARGRPRKSVTRHDSDSDEKQRRPFSDKMETDALSDLLKRRNAKLKRDASDQSSDGEVAIDSDKTLSSASFEDIFESFEQENFRKFEEQGIELSAQEKADFPKMTKMQKEQLIFDKGEELARRRTREAIELKNGLGKPGKVVPPKETSDEDSDRDSAKRSESPVQHTSRYESASQRSQTLSWTPSELAAERDFFPDTHGKESSSSSESSTNTRACSPTPEEEEQGTPIETKADIMKALLTRSTLAKFVHAPFFKNTVKDCFVRVNAGLPPNAYGRPYKIGLVLDVLETAKTYEFEEQRTNKGLKLQLGPSYEQIVRLESISNQHITDTEFQEWFFPMKNSKPGLPNMEQVQRKSIEIKDALHHIFTDTEVEQMNKERLRFEQKTGKFATEKRWLMNQKETLTEEGNLEKAAQIQLELQRLESVADELDRKRQGSTMGITWINKRNRNLMKEACLGDQTALDLHLGSAPIARDAKIKHVCGKGGSSSQKSAESQNTTELIDSVQQFLEELASAEPLKQTGDGPDSGVTRTELDVMRKMEGDLNMPIGQKAKAAEPEEPERVKGRAMSFEEYKAKTSSSICDLPTSVPRFLHIFVYPLF